jgi:hypothetical protein
MSLSPALAIYFSMIFTVTLMLEANLSSDHKYVIVLMTPTNQQHLKYAEGNSLGNHEEKILHVPMNDMICRNKRRQQNTGRRY